MQARTDKQTQTLHSQWNCCKSELFEQFLNYFLNRLAFCQLQFNSQTKLHFYWILKNGKIQIFVGFFLEFVRSSSLIENDYNSQISSSTVLFVYNFIPRFFIFRKKTIKLIVNVKFFSFKKFQRVSFNYKITIFEICNNFAKKPKKKSFFFFVN